MPNIITPLAQNYVSYSFLTVFGLFPEVSHESEPKSDLRTYLKEIKHICCMQTSRHKERNTTRKRIPKIEMERNR